MTVQIPAKRHKPGLASALRASNARPPAPYTPDAATFDTWDNEGGAAPRLP